MLPWAKRAQSPKAKSTAAATCKKATSLILDYLSGTLDPKVATKFEKHLLDCPDCVSFLNTYKKTIHAARSLRYEDIPPAVQMQVLKFIRKQLKGSPHRS